MTLTLRSVVTGISTKQLSAFPLVTVVSANAERVTIDTPRYREFTRLATELIRSGASFTEIAGNDDIMLTVTGNATTLSTHP